MRVAGIDHVDLLHRVTSNDVKGLAVGQENFQCLLNARGKIIVPFRLRRAADHCTLIAPAESREVLRATIERYIFSEDVTCEPLADLPAEPGSEDERIHAGIPKWGVDVTEDTIPWEANLTEYVSTSKGCYTGQEVIARIETYGTAPRHLVHLETAAPAPVTRELESSGEQVGAITSATSKPDAEGRLHALAIVKKTIAPGMTVSGRWRVL